MTWTHWMAALAVVFLAPAGADLETNYTKDRALHVASVSTFAMETTDFSMERDGEVVDRPFGGSGSRTTKRVETVDRVLEHEEGAPTRVRREFLAAGLESVTAFGDQEMEDERDGPLAGVTIEIAIGDNGDTEIEVVEGDVLCSCPGFEYRGSCSHARKLKAAFGRDSELPAGYSEAGLSS